MRAQKDTHKGKYGNIYRFVFNKDTFDKATIVSLCGQAYLTFMGNFGVQRRRQLPFCPATEKTKIQKI
jgi:hypothetical protein